MQNYYFIFLEPRYLLVSVNSLSFLLFTDNQNIDISYYYCIFLDFLSSSNNENKNDLNIDNKMLNKNAVKNPLTAKPDTKLLANNIITALITNKNRPRVTIVAGKVKNTNKGRTNIFSNEITPATIIAVM